MLKADCAYAEGYYIFDSFKKYDCLAAFSCGRADMGFNDNARLEDSRSEFLKKINVSHSDIVCLQQPHGNKVFVASCADKGRGALGYSDALAGYDGLVTSVNGVPLVVFTADCLSVFLYDTRKNVLALLHAGWRGTKEKISACVLDIMKDKFLCNTEDVLCAFGPSNRSCCYEVGSEFADYFPGELIQRDGKFFLDLAAINLKQLLDSGVCKHNIVDCGICTSCQNERFFSYRKDGKSAGRAMSVAMIR